MDQRVDLIKELVDNVKEKQSIDKQFNSFKIDGTRKNSKRSSILANDQAYIDPMKVTKQIAKNKEIYHGKLQQEQEKRDQNEKIKEEIKSMIKLKEDDESVEQSVESQENSKSLRNAWFHKYSKSNLPQRKKRILNIHLENQKIVKRLIDIKPHPDIILLKQTTQPLDLSTMPQNNTANGTQRQTFLNTQRDFMRDNKGAASPFEELSKMQNESFMIQKEKSCLSFINDSLGVIEETKNSKRNSMVNTSKVFRRKNDKNLSQLGLYNFEHSSRPTTSTSRSQATMKRPSTSQVMKNGLQNELKSLDLSKLAINPNQTQGSRSNPWLNNQNNSISQQQFEQTNIVNTERQNYANQSEVDSFLQRIPNTARETVKEDNNQTLQEFAQKKSYTKFKKLLELKHVRIPKDVSAVGFIQKQKFINNSVRLDQESYEMSRTSRLQKKIDDYINQEKSMLVKKRDKFIKMQ
ncbi:UNKNOWN [Stylonychia lemnae]|uniref:Uncharacterized protein n=1 Tax=Stylonychia lemnae TaxID=5949 RepID=A0A078B6M6_STYLE|nr:UNKNOWN [Stylonychia lemnae]|eukprot:CDW89213.1 UNKNOWN [Stylonychia lemnae]